MQKVYRGWLKLLWHMRKQVNDFLWSLLYNSIGCHVVAPSDMMDNRIVAIKNALQAKALSNKVRILFMIW